MSRRGLCLVLAAPSGAGKTTLSRALLEIDDQLSLSVSVTTRERRPGEKEGKHYFFITQDRFDEMVEQSELLEYARVFGRSYGTPRQPVEAALQEGRDVMFDIDWQGFRQLRASLGEDVVGVFIKPPSLEVLHNRLVKRGDTPEQVAHRMQHAEAEISHAGEFDYIVENHDLDVALADIRAILRASRLQTKRQTPG
ncbi:MULTISPECIES: guanylate kinase [unclassified Acidocella]|uniref:guanylate kinase n=1 Tax=unclassified Acidocella TaxID=2648610 RepID=UPI000A02728E|nr:MULTISPECIES: guanylate kinase [unclassified Acidocella]WBO60111.1 guanylate kinase [Acidocella sp. MX-AZ03]